MNKLVLLAGIALLLLSCGDYKNQKAGLEIRSENISSTVDRLLSHNDSKKQPGYALLVIHQGQVLHSAGYGMANFEEGLAISPISSFEDWSIITEMVNVALLKMAEVGEISLDDSIVSYLPELSEILSAQATLEHLLGSTSGIGHPESLLSDGTPWNPRAFLDYLLQNEELISFAPGEGCAFSGIAALGLGSLIIEEVSGEPLDQYLTDTFLLPLNMYQTSIALNADGPSASVLNYKRRTDGYTPIADSELEYYPRLNITLQDIAKWYSALDDGSILSDEMRELYYQRVTDNNGIIIEDEGNEFKEYYTGYGSMAGYCWENVEDGAVGYSYGLGGEYGSGAIYYPEQELRVFVYTNIPGGDAFGFLFGSFYPLMLSLWF